MSDVIVVMNERQGRADRRSEDALLAPAEPLRRELHRRDQPPRLRGRRRRRRRARARLGRRADPRRSARPAARARRTQVSVADPAGGDPLLTAPRRRRRTVAGPDHARIFKGNHTSLCVEIGDGRTLERARRSGATGRPLRATPSGSGWNDDQNAIVHARTEDGAGLGMDTSNDSARPELRTAAGLAPRSTRASARTSPSSTTRRRTGSRRPPRPDGRPVSDVVIIGGGMCGLVGGLRAPRAPASATCASSTAAPAGCEGPWVTYARMETLRSPKQLSARPTAWPRSPSRPGSPGAVRRGRLGASSSASRGRCGWTTCAGTARVLDLPVENGVEVTRIMPGGDGLLELDRRRPGRTAILARKVVHGHRPRGARPADHPGLRRRPAAAPLGAFLRRHRLRARSRGRRVVVIGVGASAVDNAAEALEAGAGEVRLLARGASRCRPSTS